MIEVISIQRYLISNEACSKNANLHEVQENQRSMPRQGRKERINTQSSQSAQDKNKRKVEESKRLADRRPRVVHAEPARSFQKATTIVVRRVTQFRDKEPQGVMELVRGLNTARDVGAITM
nr:hypothetical protein Iba_chr04aCG16910 [Ipomoea batatas]